MRFSKKILESFVDLPNDWRELMEDVGLEVKSVDGDIMNLELLANRGDHYCYLGLANEINGRTGTGLKKMENASLPLYDEKVASNYAQENKDGIIVRKNIEYSFDIKTDKCLAYSLTPYKYIGGGNPLGDYEYTMLSASGVNAILPAIDITNIILLEYGQPAHAYDADKIKGRIQIRESKSGERAKLLFHDGETELPKGTVVIADDEKILCIGGVIGCRGADVDENTKNILVEMALFDPVSIRKTERALLEKPTIAAMIFERGADIRTIESGARRAKRLYKTIGWEQNGDFQYAFYDYDLKVINLPGDYVRSELEINISDDEIEQRLNRLGFYKTLKSGWKDAKPDDYMVSSSRIWDIKGYRADLIEELARSIGYNNLPNILPVAQIGSAASHAEIRKAAIDAYLVNNGFFEVFTDNLYSPKHAKLSPISKHISIENSVDGGYSFMKNNCIVQAVELIDKNLRVKNREIRAFEWGKIFPTDASEKSILWGAINGKLDNALTAKGLLENLMLNLDLDFRLDFNFSPDRYSEQELLIPKRSGLIIIDDQVIGFFGEISPVLLNSFDIKNDTPIYFAFDTDLLLNTVSKKIKYESPSNIMPSWRDISVGISYGISAGSISEFIMDKYCNVISDVKITDVFDKPKENIRNITFALEFKGISSTEELNKLILEIMKDANDFAKK